MNKRYQLLFVDDEERVLRALKSIFRREYDVFVATNGTDALEILSRQPIDVIVSDQRMPNMSGNDLLAFVRDQYPQVMRILLTGYVDKPAIMDTINRGEIFRYISKPWNITQMTKTIAEAARASRHKLPASIADLITEPDYSLPKKSVLDDVVLSKLKVKARPSSLPTIDSKKTDNHEHNSDVNDLAASPSGASHGSARLSDMAILLIDEDQRIRNSIRLFSRRFHIAAYSAQSVVQAVRILAIRPDVGVVVMGVSIDTQATLEALNLFKQKRPDISVLALADVTDANVAIRLINEGQVFRYLQKPVTGKTFYTALAAAIRRHYMLKKVDTLSDRYRVSDANIPKTSSIQKLKELFKHSA